MYLSVVIPAYNEEKRIIMTLEKIQEFLDKRPYKKEVIVVDDGSKDKTREVVLRKQKDIEYLKLIENSHFGKGHTVKTGMLAASGENVLFTDADNATPIEEVDKLLKAIENGADIAIGSRAVKGANLTKNRSLARQLGARAGNILIQVLLLPGIKDTQTGFKLFKSQTLQPIFTKQKMAGFSFDVEVLYLARKNNLKIVEVPIHWIHKNHSTLKLTDFLKVLIDVLKIRFIS